MAALAVARGTSIATENVFESRFLYVDELRRMGADIRTEGHHAVIRGVERLSAAPVRALDIRAGAAMVIAALCADGRTVDRRRPPPRPRVRGPRGQAHGAGRRGPPRRRRRWSSPTRRRRGDPGAARPLPAPAPPRRRRADPVAPRPRRRGVGGGRSSTSSATSSSAGSRTRAISGTAEEVPAPRRVIGGLAALDIVFLGAMVVWLARQPPRRLAGARDPVTGRAVGGRPGARRGAVRRRGVRSGRGASSWVLEQLRAARPSTCPAQLPGRASAAASRVLAVVVVVVLAPDHRGALLPRGSCSGRSATVRGPGSASLVSAVLFGLVHYAPAEGPGDAGACRS